MDGINEALMEFLQSTVQYKFSLSKSYIDYIIILFFKQEKKLTGLFIYIKMYVGDIASDPQ